jgi:hypothetical protein
LETRRLYTAFEPNGYCTYTLIIKNGHSRKKTGREAGNA